MTKRSCIAPVAGEDFRPSVRGRLTTSRNHAPRARLKQRASATRVQQPSNGGLPSARAALVSGEQRGHIARWRVRLPISQWRVAPPRRDQPRRCLPSRARLSPKVSQNPNACLICRSISMAAWVYRPLVRYRSSCAVLISATTATVKPLNIGPLLKETANRACRNIKPFSEFAAAYGGLICKW